MSKKFTTEEFIRRAREVHGDKFDYSKVDYKNNYTKVCIICQIHGEFWQRPSSHLQGNGCPRCKGGKKKSLERFIQDARKVHGDWYDYSMSDYKGAKFPVYIICPKHGGFWQDPNSHLSGRGCRNCGYERNGINFKSNTIEFIAKAQKVHGDKYDYTPTVYSNALAPVEIICPIHGEFEQKPYMHLIGHGCPLCGCVNRAESNRLSQDEFIAKSIDVHGDKYGYELVVYRGMKIPVTIICPIHGAFEQNPSEHLQGCGCPECGRNKVAERLKMPFDEFVQKANKVHNNKYSYIKDKYKTHENKIYAICPIHGEFQTTHSNHLKGSGCPHCKESKGEKEVTDWLDKNNIEYQREYKVIPSQILFGRNRFEIDFYLPAHNTFIEFHGVQHYSFVPIFHKTEDKFADQQDRDRRLREYCKQNNIRLIEIPYTKIDNIDKILTKKILKSKKI